ncbi:hypothetical protein F4860DRAFT_518689 [Xylaria cubensis]|nr:hypothetical protein F4860DRAFT_518689 [Xylaria cubensis]
MSSVPFNHAQERALSAISLFPVIKALTNDKNTVLTLPRTIKSSGSRLVEVKNTEVCKFEPFLRDDLITLQKHYSALPTLFERRKLASLEYCTNILLDEGTNVEEGANVADINESADVLDQSAPLDQSADVFEETQGKSNILFILNHLLQRTQEPGGNNEVLNSKFDDSNTLNNLDNSDPDNPDDPDDHIYIDNLDEEDAEEDAEKVKFN